MDAQRLQTSEAAHFRRNFVLEEFFPEVKDCTSFNLLLSQGSVHFSFESRKAPWTGEETTVVFLGSSCTVPVWKILFHSTEQNLQILNDAMEHFPG